MPVKSVVKPAVMKSTAAESSTREAAVKATACEAAVRATACEATVKATATATAVKTTTTAAAAVTTTTATTTAAGQRGGRLSQAQGCQRQQRNNRFPHHGFSPPLGRCRSQMHKRLRRAIIRELDGKLTVRQSGGAQDGRSGWF
jgi:hypothetical protein